MKLMWGKGPMRCLAKLLQQPTTCSSPQFKCLQKGGGRTSTNTASAPSRVGASERASVSERTPAAAKSFALWQWPVSAPQACGHHPAPWPSLWPSPRTTGQTMGCCSAPPHNSRVRSSVGQWQWKLPWGLTGTEPPTRAASVPGEVARVGAHALPSPGQLSTTRSKLPASPPSGRAVHRGHYSLCKPMWRFCRCKN